MRIALVVFSFTMLQHSVSAQYVDSFTLFFPFDESDIQLHEERQLHQIISQIDWPFAHKVAITGFTDSVGSKQYNHQLAEMRAQSVYNSLYEHSDNSTTYQVEAKGELSDTQKSLSDSLCRQVRIKVYYQYPAIRPPFLPETQTYSISADHTRELNIGQHGSVLHIPVKAFVDQEGNPVSGSMKIHFTEYRSAAEMAFCGIPMHHKEKGVNGRFNRAGMFTLYGTKDGDTILLAPGKQFTLDYNMSQVVPNTNFYRFDETQQQWQELRPITGGLNEGIQDDQVEDKVQRNIAAPLGEIPEIVALVLGSGLSVEGRQINGGSMDNTLLGDGTSADPGHTYPSLVKGLNVPGFGVYNCDQFYASKTPRYVTASYIDENGKQIKGKVLSLIDLQYNGAYSFDPRHFRCDITSQNALVLFALSGDVYLCEPEEVQVALKSQKSEITFAMKNVTDTLNTSEALAKHLGIDM